MTRIQPIRTFWLGLNFVVVIDAMWNVRQIVNKLQRNIEQKNKVWSDPLHELVDILLTRTSSIKLR